MSDRIFDTWKQGVSRATAFIQSNATFQIQIAGFFFSAIVVAVAAVRPENQRAVFTIFIPIFSIIMLVISSCYFNFLAPQQSFINLYGRRLEEGQSIICHEDFVQLVLQQHKAGLFTSAGYLLRASYSIPYFILFWLYLLTPQVCYWGWRYFADALPIEQNFVAISLAFLILQILGTAQVTKTAWSAINYQRRVEAGKVQKS